ncbi:MAG TPA: phosphohydrolase [Oxalobacteraceae bacterium]|nr:phosphohydrolase [Oxalobacteraceae bacterium]
MQTVDRSLLNQAQALAVALNERDEYTSGHCDRVVSFSLELGKKCELSSAELRSLQLAAALHDVGKIGVPDRVLLKRGRLDANDWEIMKNHSEQGERILMALETQEMQCTARIVRHHHESFDGSGYPDALAGENIPVLSRIVALADSYDAMATTRPYHLPKTHREIIAIMDKESGSKFDPDIFQRFLKVVEGSRNMAG